MWLRWNAFDIRDHSAITSLGRALCLAQDFEASCHDILRWFDLVRLFKTGEASSLEQIEAHPELLRDFMLRASVRRLESVHAVPDETEKEVLSDAVDARNFVAHEAAFVLMYPARIAVEQALREEAYRRHVHALARGDNLVSTWSYEIQEREAAPPLICSVYSKDVAKWVLEPLDDGPATIETDLGC